MNQPFVNSINGWFKRLGGYFIWLLVVLLGLSIVRNIRQVARVKAEISTEESKLTRLQAQNKDLEEQINQSQGPDFIEKEIRSKLGLVMTGETMVVLPDDVTLKKLAPVTPSDQEVLPDPNWRKWEKLFF